MSRFLCSAMCSSFVGGGKKLTYSVSVSYMHGVGMSRGSAATTAGWDYDQLRTPRREERETAGGHAGRATGGDHPFGAQGGPDVVRAQGVRPRVDRRHRRRRT